MARKMHMETQNIFRNYQHSNAYKTDAVVRIKLWDKLILLFRRSKFKGYMIPIESWEPEISVVPGGLS